MSENPSLISSPGILRPATLSKDSVGVRKVRWGRAGTGKRGCAGHLPFYDTDTPLYLLWSMRRQAVRTDLSPAAKRQ
jgi:hypothetical protein